MKMKNLYDLNANIVISQHSGDSNLVQEATAETIETLSAEGYQILVGNNPRMDKAKKWANVDLIRVSQVNSRTHGKSVRTIWAVKE
jgi:UDP-N-acetylmuramyl pentapeptide synthase